MNFIKHSSTSFPKLSQNWLEQQLGLVDIEFSPLQNDASFRKYYRLHTNPTTVFMDASVDAKNQQFVAAAKLLKENGLLTPAIFHADLEKGFLQVEDFGDDLLFHHTQHSEISTILKNALDAILQIQQIPSSSLSKLKRFDKEFISRGLSLFSQWFVGNFIELQLTKSQQEILEQTFEFIQGMLIQQPYVGMHRDFHSKNLVILPHNNIGLLDFQDLMVGPVTYDLVSLLKDCYVSWPSPLVNELSHYFYERCPHIQGEKSFAEFCFCLDITGLQRHLKILGGFSKLYLQQDKHQYVQSFDRILDYVVQTAAKYEPLKDFYSVLTTAILPKLFTVQP